MKRLQSFIILILFAVGIGLFLLSWRGASRFEVAPHQSESPQTADSPTSEDTHKTVQLRVELGDGQSTWVEDVPWNQNMTVLDLLHASLPAKEKWRFRYFGSAESAFLYELGGLRNGDSDEKYWMYWVNGQFAARSFAVQTLEAGDTVLWKFATMDQAEFATSDL